MSVDEERPVSGYVTAHTAPANPGDVQGPVPVEAAGLVLLYAPSFRSMAAAYPFEKAEILVGRDPSCSIVLEDDAVSRRHARIAYEQQQWTIADLGSRNGILVDGARVEEAVLEGLAEVRIGDALFKFVDRQANDYARYRIDGLVDGTPAATGSSLVGGHAVRTIHSELARIAPTGLSCVLLGETGTGKEVLAREVHRMSGRPGPFQAIHCAAIPEGLLESELFGFRRGAFSGAQNDKAGLIQQAHQGALFLDEIGDMPLNAQVKLLRVLQTREVTRLGDTRPQHVDLRVVCATHRDLYGLVQNGGLRGDLFARLNEYAAVLPPLRERKEDIFALTLAFVARHSPQRLEAGFGFLLALLQYDWPFNVRELESAIKRATALADGGVLEARHLPPLLLEASSAAVPAAIEPSSPLRPSTPPKEGEGSRKAERSARSFASVQQDGFLRGAPTEGLLRQLLAANGGNVAAVARILDKGRMQVHRWMRRYGITIAEYRGR